MASARGSSEVTLIEALGRGLPGDRLVVVLVGAAAVGQQDDHPAVSSGAMWSHQREWAAPPWTSTMLRPPGSPQAREAIEAPSTTVARS